MSAPVRVLVADDHVATRVGVRLALEGHGFAVCAEAADAVRAIAAATRERPDLCLLDIGMPGNGIAAAAEIKLRLPETAIVMLTISRDDDDLFDSLQAGASGYLLKDTAPARLPLALRGVLDGEAALPRGLTARVIEEFRTRERSRRLRILLRSRAITLTTREWEVLELLGQGLLTSEIAKRIQTSDATVRSHVRGILKKLHAPDRKSAIRLLEGRPDG
ncbi:MAG TPA: response regulator transcription factor [Gaiellaceae bacterium]|nr:response regulator transcription factor [Gaiellaceae bacterium]